MQSKQHITLTSKEMLMAHFSDYSDYQLTQKEKKLIRKAHCVPFTQRLYHQHQFSHEYTCSTAYGFVKVFASWSWELVWDSLMQQCQRQIFSSTGLFPGSRRFKLPLGGHKLIKQDPIIIAISSRSDLMHVSSLVG